MYRSLWSNNPASVSLWQNPMLGATYRNQMPGLSSLFTTYSTFAFLPLRDMNSVVGANLWHDRAGNGTLVRNYFSAIYAYRFRVLGNTFISPALQMAYSTKRMAIVPLIYESDLTGQGASPGLSLGDRLTSFVDFTVGLTLFSGNSWQAGMAAHHITQPLLPGSPEGYQPVPLRYHIHMAGTRYLNSINAPHGPAIKPGLQVALQGLSNQVLVGANLLNVPYEFGLWVRQSLLFQYDAIVLVVGFKSGGYNFFYSYDFNIKGMRTFSPGFGAHEVTFFTEFKYKGNRKKHRAIKCTMK